MPYSVGSIRFWRAYWITLRPYLFFVSGVAGLVGLAIPHGLSWMVLGTSLVGFFFSYGLGQALTDVFQTDTDAISSPYRPLTQGMITGRQVLTVSLAGLTLCSLLIVVHNPWNLPVCGLAVAGLASYTPFKRRWWSGPPWNSWVVALLPLMGHLCGQASPIVALSMPMTWVAMGSVFFSYAVFVLLGYFKDISADRQTGYNTLVVRTGWVTSVIVSSANAAASVACSVSLLLMNDLSVPRVAGVLWLSGVAMLALAHGTMLRTRDETRTHGPIAHSVRGFILLHLGEAVALRHDLAILAVIFYLLFELALYARPERSQI